MVVLDYEAGLGVNEITERIERLVGLKRRVDWLLCRYLADLADSDLYRQLGWYSDIYDFTKKRFGLGVKLTRERLRIGRALRQLPNIEQAWVTGKLSYSRVREITRVASEKTELKWLKRAEQLPMRALERQVAAAAGTTAKTDDPIQPQWLSPEVVELRLKLPAEAYALLLRAMEGARQRASGSLSDAAAVEAVALDALAQQGAGSKSNDVRKALVLYHCDDCQRTEVETGRGAVEVDESTAARLSCGAKRYNLATEGRDVAMGGPIPAALRRAVLLRDRFRCRCCGRRRYLDVHHIDPSSNGGVHSRENCVTLCSGCHTAAHAGLLQVVGDAEGRLRFLGEDGHELPEARGELALALSEGGGFGVLRRSRKPRRQVATQPRARVPIGTDETLGTDETPGTDGTARAEATPDEVPIGAGQGGLSAEQTAVLSAMGNRGGWHEDFLCEKTGLSIAQLSTALVTLQITGLIRRDQYGWRRTTGDTARSESAVVPSVSDAAPLEPAAIQGLSSEQSKVLGALSRCTARHSDELCAATGLSVSTVDVALIELALIGRARSGTTGYHWCAV